MLTRKVSVVSSAQKAVVSNKVVRVPFRFSLKTENFHGRLAMIGMTTAGVFEHFGYKLPIIDQIQTEFGIPFMTVAATVSVLTSAFILEAVNPVTEVKEEQAINVFSKPGFSKETEILHGRIAMLAFAYALVAEQFTATVL